MRHQAMRLEAIGHRPNCSKALIPYSSEENPISLAFSKYQLHCEKSPKNRTSATPNCLVGRAQIVIPVLESSRNVLVVAADLAVGFDSV